MKNLTSQAPAVTLSEAFCDLLAVTDQRVRDGVRSAATLEMQEAHRRWWEGTLGAERPIDSIDELVLEELASRPRRPPKHAARIAGPATLRKRLSTLKQALRLEARRRRISRIPEFPTVIAPPAPSPSVLTSYMDALKLFESLPLHRAEWYWLAVWTGQRPSDVERMTWSDIDLTAQTMLIRSTKTKRGVLRERIPRPLYELLVQMHRRDNPLPSKPIVRPWPSRKTTLPLHCQKCGLPRMNAMALRHTNLSWIASRTGITPALCRHAGHSNVRQLERTYAHCLPPQLREVTDALDSMALPKGGAAA